MKSLTWLNLQPLLHLHIWSAPQNIDRFCVNPGLKLHGDRFLPQYKEEISNNYLWTAMEEIVPLPE